MGGQEGACRPPQVQRDDRYCHHCSQDRCCQRQERRQLQAGEGREACQGQEGQEARCQEACCKEGCPQEEVDQGHFTFFQVVQIIYFHHYDHIDHHNHQRTVLKS